MFLEVNSAIPLDNLAERMSSTEATKAAKMLAANLSQKDLRWASVLTAFAGRMTPAEAHNVCGHAAQMLANGIEKKVPSSIITGINYMSDSDVEFLASLASFMEPSQANRLCGQAIQSLLSTFRALDNSMILWLPQLDPQDCLNSWPGNSPSTCVRITTSIRPD